MAEPDVAKAVRLAEAVRDTGRRLKRIERHCRQDARELMQEFALLRLMLASFGVQVEPGKDEGGHSHGDDE